MAYRGFAGGGYVGHHLSVALLEGLRPAADHAGRHATIESVLGTAARYISDGISWRAVVTLDSTGTSLVDGAGNAAFGTTAVASSRALTDADNGKTLECTATVTLTVPTGLMSNFGCAIIPNGTTSIASSGGALIQGATTTLTRAAATNAIFAIVPRASAANSYVVTGT